MQFTAERVIPDRPELKPMLQEHMARYLFAEPFVQNAVVLDAGCGCGYGTHHLATAGANRVIGIDLAPEAIDYACRRYAADNLDFKIMDVMDMTFPDETFDIVVYMEVFEHVKDYQQLLSEARRVLKPGGQIIVSTPNKQIFSPGRDQPINYWHIREFYRDEFTNILASYFQDLRFWGQTVETPGLVPFILFNLRIQRYLLTHKSWFSRFIGVVYDWAMKAFMLPTRLIPGLMDKDPNIIMKAEQIPLERTLYFIALGRKSSEGVS